MSSGSTSSTPFRADLAAAESRKAAVNSLALFGNLVAAMASRGTEATGPRQRWTPAADGALPFPPESAPHGDAPAVLQRPEFLLEVRGGRRLRRAPEALVFPPRPSITSRTACLRPRSSARAASTSAVRIRCSVLPRSRRGPAAGRPPGGGDAGSVRLSLPMQSALPSLATVTRPRPHAARDHSPEFWGERSRRRPHQTPAPRHRPPRPVDRRRSRRPRIGSRSPRRSSSRSSCRIVARTVANSRRRRPMHRRRHRASVARDARPLMPALPLQPSAVLIAPSRPRAASAAPAAGTPRAPSGP